MQSKNAMETAALYGTSAQDMQAFRKQLESQMLLGGRSNIDESLASFRGIGNQMGFFKKEYLEFAADVQTSLMQAGVKPIDGSMKQSADVIKNYAIRENITNTEAIHQLGQKMNDPYYLMIS